MSSTMNLESEAIRHIDDACEEEYVESFAPKAQEEVLSEIQPGDSDLNSNQNDENTMNENDISRNIADEIAENSECIDISNYEEINATSNELVHEVMSEIESNLVLEDEHISNDVVNENSITDEKIMNENITNVKENLEDNKQASEDCEIKSETTNVEVNIVDDEKVVEDTEAIKKQASEDYEIKSETTNVEVNIVDDENVVEDTEAIEKQASEDYEIKSETTNVDLNIVDNEKVVEDTEAIENQPDNEACEIQQEIINSTKEISQKTNEPSYSPTKGKDVKSLSTAYGREENLINVNCCVCNKKVYPMEKLVANDKTFHKTCFRCSKCKSALSTGNYSFNQQRPYCTPHYIELFKKRGRYDEVDDNVEKEIPATNDINDVLTDELPAPDTTKKIVAKFQNFETGNTSSINQNANVDSVDELPAPNTTKILMEKFSAIQQDNSEGKCKPQIDIPRHSNGHSNGTSENVPVVLPTDVVRANDPSQDNRPEQGITKNLVNRFHGMGGSLNN